MRKPRLVLRWGWTAFRAVRECMVGNNNFIVVGVVVEVVVVVMVVV